VWEGGENGEFADALVGAGEKLIAKLPAYAPAIDAVIDNAAGMIQMAAADKKAVERFLEKTQHGREAFRIPAFATDVHDLQSLAELGAFLI